MHYVDTVPESGTQIIWRDIAVDNTLYMEHNTEAQLLTNLALLWWYVYIGLLAQNIKCVHISLLHLKILISL